MEIVGSTPARGRTTGTSITFWPDPTIFTAEGTEFVARTVLERLQTMAFLNRGLEIVFKDERPEREQEEAPSIAIKALGLQRGQVVADIGAGSGYYTERMAREVGPTGKVYATDIQPGMLDLPRRRLADTGLQNVVPVLGTPDDPKLPADSLDLALMVDVYH